MFPEWLPIPQISLFNVMISIAIFILSLILRKAFVKYIYKFFHRLAKKTTTEVDEKILSAFEKPARFLIVIIGLYIAILNLEFVTTDNIVISRLFRSSIIALIFWGIYVLEDPHSGIFTGFSEKLNIHLDKILIPFISRVLRIITLVLAISIIAEEWDYHVESLIAGLGLGGLAFALAAKDSLANIFGGMVIILDKPFSIGDWICTSNVEGTVEDITFRSTRIRTFAQAIVTVPNSTLANEAITNWSKRGKRRISFNLGVTYTTSKEKLQKCVDRIKEMLINHPSVHYETIFVTFDKFNDSSLDIFLYFFTNTTDWEEYLNIKQDVNFRIMEILEMEDVSVAFPSTSVYLETPTIYLETENSTHHDYLSGEQQ